MVSLPCKLKTLIYVDDGRMRCLLPSANLFVLKDEKKEERKEKRDWVDKKYNRVYIV